MSAFVNQASTLSLANKENSTTLISGQLNNLKAPLQQHTGLATVKTFGTNVTNVAKTGLSSNQQRVPMGKLSTNTGTFHNTQYAVAKPKLSAPITTTTITNNITVSVNVPQHVTPKAEPIPDPTPISVVPDIDAKDANDIMACSEYAPEIYEHFRAVEAKKVASDSYMKRQTDINEKMRAILVDWLVDVHHKFKLLPETLYLTVNIIDRFLTHKLVSRQKLQLVGVTAMLLASKYEEVYAPQVKDFVYISAQAYTNDEILRMERLVLSTLTFDLTVPTTYHFLKRFLKAAGADQKFTLLAYYFAELALLDYKFLQYLPSHVAASAVLLAQKHLYGTWDETLEHYTGYSADQLSTCASDILVLAKNIEKSRLQAVYKKYCSPRRLEVAKLISSTASSTTNAMNVETNQM